MVSQEALARARLTSPYACGSSCKKPINTPVPTSSDFLLATQCAGYAGNGGAVPESIRVAQVEQYTLDCGYGGVNGALPSFVNPKRPPVLTVCPPIPQWYLTAGEPKPQMAACPLPNKPYNPVLPGN